MSIRPRRPSASMVVAVTALVFAVGGTSYAALSLPAGSVGTKQLKRGAVTTNKIHSRAVTGAKVAVNSLTGLNIRESSLATVPSAALAGNAGKLNGLTAASLSGSSGRRRRPTTP